jgi:hypothetical protein
MNGAIHIKESKINKAIPQTLSAIVYASEQMELSGKKIDLELRCLLPAGEIVEDRSRLEVQSIAAIKNFGTLSRNYMGNVRSFTCKPEGTGLLRKFSELINTPLEELSVGVFSIGYRNLGFFSLIGKAPGHYRSPRLGFSSLIQEFRSMVGGLDEVNITKELSKYLETGDRRWLEKIVKRGICQRDVLHEAKKRYRRTSSRS